MFNNYEVIVLLSGLLGMYARYNFIRVFRENKPENYKPIILGLGLFYIVSNAVYFSLEIPIMNLIVQIVFLMLLGRIMGFGVKKIILSTSIIIVILVVIESVIVFITGYVSDSIFLAPAYRSMLGIIAVDVITFTTSKLFAKFKNVSNQIGISVNYWIAIFIFSGMSLFLLMVIFKFSVESKMIVIASTVIVLIMNVVMFTLYDSLMWHYERKLDDAIIQHMNASYAKQLELMRAYIMDIRSFKHDINRHISSMSTLVLEEKYNELSQYIDEVKENTDSDDMISNTGNVIIDSIINFEVYNTKTHHDSIQFRSVNIPSKLNIKDYDLTVILSNVLSNAFNAIKNIREGKTQIILKYDKGVLSIQIENDFHGNLNIENGNILTTKEQPENHGYGIANAKKAVKKYNGTMSLEYSDMKFKTEIIMYEEDEKEV